MTPEDIKKGRELLAKATQGEWTRLIGSAQVKGATGYNTGSIAHCEDNDDLDFKDWSNVEMMKVAKANADHIAWLHNHAKELLDAAEELETCRRDPQRVAIYDWLDKNPDKRIKDLSDLNGEIERENDELRTQLAESKAEVERLRRTLQLIAGCQHGWRIRCPSCKALLKDALDRAQKLEGK